MNIQLNDDQLKGLVSESILRAVDEKTRDQLITAAIKHLLTPGEGSSYGSKKSPLQEAFSWAVDNYARKFATEHLEKNEAFKAGIESLFADVAKKLFSLETREALVSEIAELIKHGLTKNRY